MKSIKGKVVGLIVLCAIVSTVISGGLGLLQTMKTTNQDAEQIMSMQCENASSEINSTLSRIAQSVDTLAELAVQSLDNFDSFKKSSKYVENYTKALEPIALEFANNTEGALTYYIRYNPEFTEPTSGIFATRDSENAAFQQLTPTDFSSFDPSDLEHVGWYYIPVQNGKATWMDPYFNSNINVYMISYVVPIYMNGESVGIVGMDVDFSKIEGVTENTKVYQTGSSFLVNSANQVMYHKELEFGTALADVNGGEMAKLAEGLNDASKAGAHIDYKYQGVKRVGCYQELVNGMKLILTAPQAEIQSKSSVLIAAIAVAGLIAVVFSALVGFFLSTGIVAPIKQITGVVQQIAELNLHEDEHLEKLGKLKDETGVMSKAVHKMNTRLINMVQQLEETGQVVMDNAEKLKISSADVSEMCSDNSATTQELAAAMEEASATSANATNNIESMNDSAKDIMELSQKGEEDSRQILERAKELSSTTLAATQQTKTMYEQVREQTEVAIEKSKAVDKINELTDTIMQISTQTNLLALNASIEAARAGESGRGFAVVADEIGNLAGQTQATVKNIHEIIDEVYQAVSSMTECLNSSTEFLEKTVLADYGKFMQVGEQYEKDAENYESNMKNIGEAVRAEVAALNMITESIEGISRMTEESAQGISLIAEKTTAIVQKMEGEEALVAANREKAQKLGEIVGEFTIG